MAKEFRNLIFHQLLPNIYVADFNLTKREINLLYMKWRRTVNTFLRGKIENSRYVIKLWNFNNYIRMFRNDKK